MARQKTTSCMPPEWVSDDSMLGYFGPLDSSSKNPVVLRQRESRLAFWRELLLNAFRTHPALANVDPIISVPILKVLLRRNNLFPMGVHAIIADLVEHNLAVPVEQFLQPEGSWWSKIVSFMSSPPKRSDHTQYVLVPIVEERIKAITDTISKSDAVMPLEEFTSLAKGVHIDLLKPSSLNITTFEVRDTKAIKITTKAGEGSNVSDSDRALFHIKVSVRKIEEREAKYASDVKLLRSEVVALLKEGNRPRAALLLRRARLYEAQLDKAMKARDQLLRIMASIEEAQTSAEVFEAMQLGAHALKSENHRVGGVEKVDTLMDTVSELVDEQEAISEAIGSSQGFTNVDQSLLEEELAELTREHHGPVPSSSSRPTALPTTNSTLLQSSAPTSGPEIDRLLEELQSITVSSPITAPHSQSGAKEPADKNAEAM